LLPSLPSLAQPHIHRIVSRVATTGRLLDKPKAAGAAQDSFPADRARRRNNRRLKALGSAQDLAEAVAPRSPLKAEANARAGEKGHVPASLGHSPARRAEAEEKERAAEKERGGANVRAVENVPAGANARVVASGKVAEKLWPAASVRVDAVMAAVAVIVDVVRPPSRVPRAAVRVLRPDNP
jgi:hypothetical protein